MARGTRIGYLRQEAVDAFAGRHNTVHDEMLTIFAGLREQEAMLRELEHRMAEAHDDDPAGRVQRGAGTLRARRRL